MKNQFFAIVIALFFASNLFAQTSTSPSKNVQFELGALVGTTNQVEWAVDNLFPGHTYRKGGTIGLTSRLIVQKIAFRAAILHEQVAINKTPGTFFTSLYVESLLGFSSLSDALIETKTKSTRLNFGTEFIYFKREKFELSTGLAFDYLLRQKSEVFNHDTKIDEYDSDSYLNVYCTVLQMRFGKKIGFETALNLGSAPTITAGVNARF